MTQAVREFLSRLAMEEAMLNSRLIEDSYGLAFFTTIKEFDHYYYNLMRHESSETSSEHFYLMRLALPRLIQKTFSSIPDFKVPIVTFQSDRALVLAALNMVARFGFIEHGKRMAYATMAGECELKKINDSFFEFHLPAELYNYEAHEADVENHYRRLHRKHRDDLVQKRFGTDGTIGRLNQIFLDNAYVYRDHFIGYNAHPDLDDYFFGLAYSDFEDHEAFDTFHHKLTFGGIQYQNYILCLIYMLSVSLKHEKFCEALLQKHNNIRLRDIITVSGGKREFIETIKHAVNYYGPSFDWFTPINADEAEAIYNVLSIRRGNRDLLERGFMSVPYLIEFSDTAIIKSIAGAQLDPSEFLLESLRYNFSTDYDRNQKTREDAMQKAIERLLRQSFPSLRILKNINIRQGNRTVTDIDFVAIEELSRTAILFQLKHQDHYGGDIRKRSNRARRLKEETEKWLRHVNNWLYNTSRSEVYASLQLKKNAQIDYFYIVAISKNFAHFLSPLASNQNFAYANWVQFYDALIRINATQGDLKTLKGLFVMLREYMSHNKIKPQYLDGSDLYNLDTLKYRIIQSS